MQTLFNVEPKFVGAAAIVDALRLLAMFTDAMRNAHGARRSYRSSSDRSMVGYIGRHNNSRRLVLDPRFMPMRTPPCALPRTTVPTARLHA